jgi:hypothetical protein
MREYLTADDICNQISMNRSVFKGNIMLTEGTTDQRLFNKFIDKRSTRTIPAYSKDNVRSVVNKMSYRGDGKVMGIVDRDLDELEGRVLSPPIFYTDYRDMEMMLINSPALDQVIAEYGDTDRVERFEKQYGSIRDTVISSAYHIGLLMYISIIRGYNLNFRNLNFRNFINKKDLGMDVHKMIREVILNTSGCEISSKGIERDLSMLESKHSDKIPFARGHDAVDILLIGLRDNFGAYNASNLNEGALGGSLRLAYSAEYFAKTRLLAETSEWARTRGTSLWSLNRSSYPQS